MRGDYYDGSRSFCCLDRRGQILCVGFSMTSKYCEICKLTYILEYGHQCVGTAQYDTAKWTCSHCGTVNPAEQFMCSKCTNVSGNDVWYIGNDPTGDRNAVIDFQVRLFELNGKVSILELREAETQRKLSALREENKRYREALEFILIPVNLHGSSRDQLHDIIQEHLIEANKALAQTITKT